MDRDRKRLSSSSSRDILRLLLNEERESQELNRRLSLATQQLKSEKQRADEAERRAKDVLSRLVQVNDARLAALQDASRTKEELALYKSQLALAQREIFKAQDVLATLEAERNAAEQEAAKTRTTVRQLVLEKDVALAREHGRREGLREGMQRGRELGYAQGRARRRATQDTVALSPLPEEDEPPTTPLPPLRDRQTASPTPTPSVRPPPQPSTDYVRPTPIREFPPSPRHPIVDIPPDNWIPSADSDSIIRLPPPHELSRLPPPSRTPPSPSPSLPPPLPPLPMPPPPHLLHVEEEPALMIPPFPIQRPESAASQAQSSSSTPRKRRSRRHSSPDSSSTTISQLDMLHAPAQMHSTARAGTPLSVIQEVISTQTSPNTTRDGSLGSPSRHGGVLPLKIPTPLSATSNLSTGTLEDHARNAEHYHHRRRDVSVDSSSSDTELIGSPEGSRIYNERRASSSSRTNSINFTIVPPSRPDSNASVYPDPIGVSGDYLSPAHADRPVPLPDVPAAEEEEPLAGPGPANAPFTPIVLAADDDLPPGFVPTGSFSPSSVPLPPPPASLSPITLSGAFTPPTLNGGNGNGNYVVPAAAPAEPASRARKKKRNNGDVAVRFGPADSDEAGESSSSSGRDRKRGTPSMTPSLGHKARSRGGEGGELPRPEPEVSLPLPPMIPAVATTTTTTAKNKRKGKGKK